MNTATSVKTFWGIDPTHSEIQFKVKHMMVSTVTGSFTQFSGQAETTSEDFTDATFSFTADANSINTNSQQRDDHLRSEDFFNAAEFPTISFQSKSFTKKISGKYELIGDLTIRGISKEINLEVIYNGSAIDPYGQTKAGFELEGKISRKEFGLKWNALTEAGGVMVSDEVRLVLNVQLVKQ